MMERIPPLTLIHGDPGDMGCAGGTRFIQCRC
jgi:hypothetical protein